jgi:MFS family permease
MGGVLQAFQIPAFVAATTQLVPAKHRQRAAGMSSFSEAVGAILGPGLAGILMRFGGLDAVLLADLVTFLVAAATLAAVRFPPLPAAREEGKHGSWFADLAEGWHWIASRPGLVAITLWFVSVNLLGTMTWFALLGPMVLARSGNDPLAYAQVQSAMGFGTLAAGLVLAGWGGPARLIHGMFGGAALSFLCGDLLLAFGRSTWVWSMGAFLGAAFIPPIIAANRALWQAKTPHDLQGRVLSLQGTLRMALMPLGLLLAGPLADRVFEPAMHAGAPLAALLGPLLGVGPGAGMALMFSLTGVLGTLGSLAGYLVPRMSHVQEELPDAAG